MVGEYELKWCDGCYHFVHIRSQSDCGKNNSHNTLQKIYTATVLHGMTRILYLGKDPMLSITATHVLTGHTHIDTSTPHQRQAFNQDKTWHASL